MCEDEGPGADYECAIRIIARLGAYYGFTEQNIEDLETIGDFADLARRVVGRAMAEFGQGVAHEVLVEKQAA